MPGTLSTIQQEVTVTFSLRKTLLATATVAGVVGLLAGCGSAPSTTKTTKASSYLPCAVSDVSGFNDHSFNQLTLAGVKQAATKLGVTPKSVESTSSNDYAANIANLISQKCNLIVVPGFTLQDAMEAAAKKNPKIDFVYIDGNGPKETNVKDIVYETDEAAFLGGYAAAAYSKTGVVGTWGGLAIPSVTIYMDGIADGVAYYNQQKGKHVKLLGWDEATQKGSFVGGFTDQNKAKNLSAGMLNQKADVIIPVAGNLYQGAAAAIASAGADAVIEGVDADVYYTDPKYRSVLLMSILKGLQQTTYTATLQAGQGGTFDNSLYVGTLKNNGVGVSPFHDFASKVPSTLAGELKTIQSGIIAGTIKVASPSGFNK